MEVAPLKLPSLGKGTRASLSDACLGLWKRYSTFVFIQGGSNAIYWASRHGHVDTLKFLNENKCPLDVKDKVRPLIFLGTVGSDKRLLMSVDLPYASGPKAIGPVIKIFLQRI